MGASADPAGRPPPVRSDEITPDREITGRGDQGIQEIGEGLILLVEFGCVLATFLVYDLLLFIDRLLMFEIAPSSLSSLVELR